MKRISLTLALLFSVSEMIFASNDSAQKIGVSDAGVFVALITLTLMISFAVPTFVTKRWVKDLVQKNLEIEQKKADDKAKKELSRTDAHLSRMIAFLLMDRKYYAWAVGWGFRALKRYKGISGDYQPIYREFHQMVLHDIIRRSIDNMKDDRSDEIGYGGSSSETEQLMKIRAIKDFVDFEFEIYELSKDENYAKEMRENFKDDLKAIHSGMISFWNELTYGNRAAIKEKLLLQSSHKSMTTELDSFIFSTYIKEF